MHRSCILLKVCSHKMMMQSMLLQLVLMIRREVGRKEGKTWQFNEMSELNKCRWRWAVINHVMVYGVVMPVGGHPENITRNTFTFPLTLISVDNCFSGCCCSHSWGGLFAPGKLLFINISGISTLSHLASLFLPFYSN